MGSSGVNCLCTWSPYVSILAIFRRWTFSSWFVGVCLMFCIGVKNCMYCKYLPESETFLFTHLMASLEKQMLFMKYNMPIFYFMVVLSVFSVIKFFLLWVSYSVLNKRVVWEPGLNRVLCTFEVSNQEGWIRTIKEFPLWEPNPSLQALLKFHFLSDMAANRLPSPLCSFQ